MSQASDQEVPKILTGEEPAPQEHSLSEPRAALAGSEAPQLPPGNDLLHEGNNLMMVLLGQAEMLKDGTAKEKEVGQNVKLMVEAAVRMGEVWAKLRALLENDFSQDEIAPAKHK